jgi:hypothetical protein
MIVRLADLSVKDNRRIILCKKSGDDASEERFLDFAMRRRTNLGAKNQRIAALRITLDGRGGWSK